jgi:proteic killer suppression protein
MIRNFRHRGLKRLFEDGERTGIRPDLIEKVERILSRLEAASAASDMDIPGYRLHRLRGNRKDFWAVTVSRNWRLIFRIENGNACDVDFMDYH